MSYSKGTGTQECKLYYDRVGTKALELEGKQGLPTGAIRESLEVVTLGLECRFSRQREEALCNCLLSSGFSSWGKVWRSLEGGRLL